MQWIGQVVHADERTEVVENSSTGLSGYKKPSGELPLVNS